MTLAKAHLHSTLHVSLTILSIYLFIYLFYLHCLLLQCLPACVLYLLDVARFLIEIHISYLIPSYKAAAHCFLLSNILTFHGLLLPHLDKYSYYRQCL